MTFNKSVRLSLIGHVLFMWLATGMPVGCAGGGGEGSEAEKAEEQGEHKKEDEQKIAEKDAPEQPLEITITHRHIEKTAEQIAYEKAQEFIKNCQPFFGGIGVTHDGTTGVITKAHKYYPAHTAGIRDGDRLLNLRDIRGEVGTAVVVQIVRNGVRMDFNVIRGKICLEEIKK